MFEMVFRISRISSIDITINQTVWNIVRLDLGFDSGRLEDDGLKKILSGLSSIVDGLGVLRAHAESAHGRGRTRYIIHSRQDILLFTPPTH